MILFVKGDKMALLNAYILLVCSVFLCSSGVIMILDGLDEMGQYDITSDMYVPPPIKPNNFEPTDTCTCDHGLVALPNNIENCDCDSSCDNHDYVIQSICTCNSSIPEFCNCNHK